MERNKKASFPPHLRFKIRTSQASLYIMKLINGILDEFFVLYLIDRCRKRVLK